MSGNYKAFEEGRSDSYEKGFTILRKKAIYAKWMTKRSAAPHLGFCQLTVSHIKVILYNRHLTEQLGCHSVIKLYIDKMSKHD